MSCNLSSKDRTINRILTSSRWGEHELSLEEKVVMIVLVQNSFYIEEAEASLYGVTAGHYSKLSNKNVAEYANMSQVEADAVLVHLHNIGLIRLNYNEKGMHKIRMWNSRAGEQKARGELVLQK